MSESAKIERLALTVAELSAATAIGRNRIYSAIAGGALKSFSIGRRVLVSADSARDWIALMEKESPEKRRGAPDSTVDASAKGTPLLRRIERAPLQKGGPAV